MLPVKEELVCASLLELTINTLTCVPKLSRFLLVVSTMVLKTGPDRPVQPETDVQSGPVL
jgi:hypothetical protein